VWLPPMEIITTLLLLSAILSLLFVDQEKRNAKREDQVELSFKRPFFDNIIIRGEIVEFQL
jgi:hypothetical protein